MKELKTGETILDVNGIKHYYICTIVGIHWFTPLTGDCSDHVILTPEQIDRATIYTKIKTP